MVEASSKIPLGGNLAVKAGKIAKTLRYIALVQPSPQSVSKRPTLFIESRQNISRPIFSYKKLNTIKF